MGIAVIGLLCAGSALGQAPLGTTFTYQGQLMESGEPVSDTVDFRFSLWDAAVGGGQLGVDFTAYGVGVVDGLFTTEIDSANFGPTAFNGDARWLEIEVYDSGSGWVPLSPRQPITPAPYALYAVDGGGGGGTCLWNENGSDIYYNTGDVGVGTSTPDYPLHAISTGGGTAVGGENPGESTSGYLGHEYGGVYGEGSYAGYFVGRGYFSGDVGVGLTNPSEKLDVNGTVKMTGFELSTAPASGYVLTSDAGGVGTWQPGGGGSLWQENGTKIYYNTDNVGIGTADPNVPLHVTTSGDPVAVLARNTATSGTGSGVWAETATTEGSGVFGQNTASSGQNEGVMGVSWSSFGKGVMGYNGSTASTAIGVLGRTSGGAGVQGEATSTSAYNKGVYGLTSSPNGYGVYGYAPTDGKGVAGYSGDDDYGYLGWNGGGIYGYSADGYGVHGQSASTSGTGVYGLAAATSGTTYGVHGQSASTTGRAVYGEASNTNSTVDDFNYGGYFTAASDYGHGIYAEAQGWWGHAVHGEATGVASTTNYGGFFRAAGRKAQAVHGETIEIGDYENYGGHFTATGRQGKGVYGEATSTSDLGSRESFGGYFVAAAPLGRGVYGKATNTGNYENYGGYFEAAGRYGRGVYGKATGLDAYAVYGEATYENGYGGYFIADNLGATGIYARADAAYATAGYFEGDVDIIGILSKSSGTFKIDHPLDPENKYLYHSFVESPDMMNIYNGNVVLDANGEAVVTMPEWFEALNMEFRYQLTCIGGFAQVYIASEIADNQFKIAGGKPGLKVSWQVTGVRQDPFANANRVQVEVDKPDDEIGTYLHPEAWGMPAELQTDAVREARELQEKEEAAAELAD